MKHNKDDFISNCCPDNKRFRYSVDEIGMDIEDDNYHPEWEGIKELYENFNVKIEIPRSKNISIKNEVFFYCFIINLLLLFYLIF